MSSFYDILFIAYHTVEKTDSVRSENLIKSNKNLKEGSSIEF